ncbi:DUF2976 domain-containing protein [Shewanella sp. Iso12]|uniref:DUF2976 domain-containing protein n=1 Tax=Shewanella sp. Iso12 TaxID=1826753 RepID=UPI00142F94BA|nr:DUF2976 domain-containing protein [Shewanella sp. Iso12]NJI86967.1 DUF2976 domain-containing protein [Shewanella sp. Iso12]
MKNLKSMKKYFYITVATLFAPNVIAAGIPTTDEFADGADDKNGFELLFWILEKLSQFVVVALSAFFLIVIIKGAIAKYDEISDGKGGYIDLGGHVVAGLGLLTLAIVMFNWIGTWTS